MYLKARFYAFIFISLFTITSQISADARDLKVSVSVDLSDKKNPTLQILNGEKKFDAKYKIATAPLILTIGENGEIGQILDPDFFAENLIYGISKKLDYEPNSDVTVFPGYEDDYDNDYESCCSLNHGCNCMKNGAVHLFKGIGMLSGGAIIVTFVIGKFLVIKTYKATDCVCKKLYSKISEYYHQKQQQ